MNGHPEIGEGGRERRDDWRGLRVRLEGEKRKGLRVVLSALEFESSSLPVTATATV
jgi:hypothetical protein